MPNDGYLYGPEYSDDRHDLLVPNEETEAFVYHIYDAVVAAFPGFLDAEGKVEALYDLGGQRLALYFWNADETRCITVKYEYGFHEGTKAITERRFDLLKRRHGRK